MTDTNKDLRPVNTFIAERVLELESGGTITRTEIAEQAGFLRPEFLDMLMRGAARLPMRSIPKLSAALEVDPWRLVRLKMLDEWEHEDGLRLALLTTVEMRNECAIVSLIRDVSADSDPELDERLKSYLRVAITGMRAKGRRR